MEKERNKILFELLKKDIADTFLQENSTSSNDISQWKGIEIIYFQEHLLKKVKANVSEKWFYTYFKSNFEKLPRIDMLNLLTQYAGYKSWADFCNIHKEKISHLDVDISTLLEKNINKEEYSTLSDNENIATVTDKRKFYKNKIIQRAFAGLLLICFSILGFIGYKKYTEFELYFFDANNKKLIKDYIEITPLFNSNAEIIQNENGFYLLNSNQDTVTLKINSNYYKADTIKLNLKKSSGKESITMIADDYANLLYYYSKKYTQNITKKRKYLNSIIDNDAVIYKSFDNEDFGYEVFTKQEYIDLLTTPTTSLKNFNLLKSKTYRGKIVEIRFKIVDDYKKDSINEK